MLINKIENIPLKQIIPYARNARTHTEDQITAIAASIKEFGFIFPVVVDTEMVVISGHGRLLAAERLGIETIPCIKVEHLTKTQVKALRLVDNQLATRSRWNENLLKLEIEDLKLDNFNLDVLGFEDLGKYLDENMLPEDVVSDVFEKQDNILTVPVELRDRLVVQLKLRKPNPWEKVLETLESENIIG